MVVNYLLAIIIDEHVKKRNSVIKHKELTKIMNDDKTTCNKMLCGYKCTHSNTCHSNIDTMEQF